MLGWWTIILRAYLHRNVLSSEMLSYVQVKEVAIQCAGEVSSIHGADTALSSWPVF